MALFNKIENKLELVKQKEFTNEKELQLLIEKNLETIFNCKFIASEFSTGSIHAGRIDTLALSEDGNPVIIEFKVVESSQLINQSLFYLSWLNDHKGDFQVATESALNQKIEIDWSDIRVLCIAPGYKKYDLHAVEMMGANIELWEYKYYENGVFCLEEVFKKSKSLTKAGTFENNKNPIMVEAGKKAAITRATGSYTFDEHVKKIDSKKENLVINLQSFILDLEDTIEEVPKKLYVAYKVTQNFVCMEIHKNEILLYLKINPEELEIIPKYGRDVRNIGHFGTGDFELRIKNIEELEGSKEFIKKAFKNIGG